MSVEQLLNFVCRAVAISSVSFERVLQSERLNPSAIFVQIL